MMETFWDDVVAFFSGERVATLIRVLIYFILGWVLSRVLSTVGSRILTRRGSAHQSQMVRRFIRYSVLILVLLSVFNELGFDLGVLLGAAGLLTIAVGFAAQTSTSNLISGLFLLGERPFGVGDVITVAATTGEVLSIDLLSVKLRTFDNLFVRIPNETLLRTEIRNLSRFPIRRLEIPLKLPYEVDFPRAKGVLRGVAAGHPGCLDEPSPQLVFIEMGDHGYTVQLNVWVARERFAEVRGSLHAELVAALRAAGIRIPMPRQALFAGGEAIPVRLVPTPEEPAPGPPTDEGATSPPA